MTISQKKWIDVEEDVGTSFQQINTPENEEASESDSESRGIVLDNPQNNKGPSIRIKKDHPTNLIIGNLNEGVTTRSRDVISNSFFVSKFEPKNVKEALTDDFWINVMQEELCQFIRNEV